MQRQGLKVPSRLSFRIDEIGGTVRAIESGFQQREIQEAAYRYQRMIEAGDRVIVGVSRFDEKENGGSPIQLQKIDPRLEDAQKARLAAFRESRDGAAAESSLKRLEAAARGRDSLMPRILAAVEARATLGEISDRLREVFGAHAPKATI